MDVISVPTAVYDSILGGREKGETDGNSLCTSNLERSTGSQETNPSHLGKLSVSGRDTLTKNVCLIQ